MKILSSWTSTQKHVVAASFMVWTLDALDFFLLIFSLKYMATEFHASIIQVSLGTTLTLACRPVGAYLFGRLADRYGRRPILMFNVFVYSILSFCIGFVPNLTTFLIVTASFGVGMGGVWGICSSLAMETIEPKSRGLVSGLLQSGYSTGYLLSSALFGLTFAAIGWRGMFMVCIVPALLLIPYIYFKVPESPVFDVSASNRLSTVSVLRTHWKLTLYAIFLATALIYYSHGTQDLYPTFLLKRHGLTPGQVGMVVTVYTIGAILGSVVFGSLSQRYGRRRMMIAAALLAIPTMYIWAFSGNALGLTIGAFFVNFFVQGCWSIIPAYLNELSPAGARGTFAGTVYQLGSLFGAANLTLQTEIANSYGYGLALASVAILAAIVITVMLMLGPEAHNVSMKQPQPVAI
jgi:SHS family lactate transporter-like MFS transporter